MPKGNMHGFGVHYGYGARIAPYLRRALTTGEFQELPPDLLGIIWERYSSDMLDFLGQTGKLSEDDKVKMQTLLTDIAGMDEITR